MIHQVKRLEKQVGIWMVSNSHWSLLLTCFSNKAILTWLTKKKNKKNVVGEVVTPPISEKKKIYLVNKTEKSQASHKTVDTHKSNKTDTVK